MKRQLDTRTTSDGPPLGTRAGASLVPGANVQKARVSYGVSDLEMDFLGHFQPACDLVTRVALVPL